jgi:hypothetical protein
MVRTRILAAVALTLVACRKNDKPIGYTPSSEMSAAREEPPPTGGAGFDFGMDPVKVQKQCRARNGELGQSGSVTTCLIRNAQVGATLLTLIEYCRGVTCRVHSVAVIERADAESWLVPFEHLRRELQRDYGSPDEQETNFPADCEKDFADCVRSGKASATLRWRWEDGHAVMLRLGGVEQVPAAISVSYSDGTAASAR